MWNLLNFGSISIPDYLAVIIIVASCLIIGKLFLYVAKRYLSAYAKKTATPIDDEMIRAVRLPIYAIILFLGFWLSLPYLQSYIGASYLPILYGAYDAALLILLGIIVYKVFSIAIVSYGHSIAKKTETKIDDVLIPVINKFGKVIIVILVFLLVLSGFGIDVTAPLAGLGILGLAIAFAAQDTISNFIAGFFLMTDRPFKEGDVIQLPSREGGDICRVVEIGARRTKLYDINTHNYIIVPNLDLSKWKIVNWNLPDKRAKVTIPVMVKSNQDLETIGSALLEVTKATPILLKTLNQRSSALSYPQVMPNLT